MKRLRYIIWAFVACVEDELHPSTCLSENVNANQYDRECSCDYALCTFPEGHPGMHGNDFDVTWK